MLRCLKLRLQGKASNPSAIIARAFHKPLQGMYRMFAHTGKLNEHSTLTIIAWYSYI